MSRPTRAICLISALAYAALHLLLVERVEDAAMAVLNSDVVERIWG